MISLIVNGQTHELDVTEDMTLLWVLRDYLNLKGTKYGCGIAECGACTIHVNGEPELSCQMAVEDVIGKKITTIEGLADDHPVKQAWIKEQVPQCGYCQPGQMMKAASLLAKDKNPNEETIVEHMDDPISAARRGWLQLLKSCGRKEVNHEKRTHSTKVYKRLFDDRWICSGCNSYTGWLRGKWKVRNGKKRSGQF